MKISILQKNFKKGLAMIGNITSKNINLPILNNILIKAEAGKINLIATNLEIGITHVVRGKIEADGAFAADSKIISNYIGLLPNERINLELKETKASIDCGKYKTKINIQPSEDFPLIPQLDKTSYYKVKSIELFKNALSQVVFAVSTSDSRLELSGVLFIFRQNELTLAATDSYRLAEKTIILESNQPEVEETRIIVPAKTVQEIIRILSNVDGEDDVLEEGGEVKCYLGENQIMFQFGSTEIISRIIEGQFPDYKEIIPPAEKTVVLIEKQELMRAVKTSSIFSRNDINDISLDIPKDKNKIIISSCSDVVGENIVELEAKTKGDENSLVLNYRYLLDGLNNIKGEMIKLDVVDNNAPCILRPEGDSSYLYLIMPIKR